MRLLMFLPAMVVAAAAANDDAWPWRKWCHDVSPASYNMCVSHRRSDLPLVSTQGSFEISWLRREIAMHGRVASHLSNKLKFWHSGILIQDLGSPMTLYFQYEALHFDPINFFPAVTADRKLVWNNTAVVGWLPYFKPSEWSLKVPIGKVSGSVLNKWFDWVPRFGTKQPGYSLWSVWDRAGMLPTMRNKFEYHRDSCCHRFTEDALRAFHEAGANFSSMTQPLCRNYFALILRTLSPLTRVDPADQGEWKQLVEYYDEFSHLVETPLTHPVQFTKTLMKLVRNFAFTAYVADSDHSNYYMVRLGVPYIAYLHQRMILPWQSGGTPSECWRQDNTSMPEADFYGEDVSIVV